MSRLLNRFWKPLRAIEADHISVTSGVTNALEALAWSLMDVGDAVLIGRPFYMGFPIAFTARVACVLKYTSRYNKDVGPDRS